MPNETKQANDLMPSGEVFNAEQQAQLIALMNNLLTAPPRESGKMPVQSYEELNANREQLIEQELKPLMTSYLDGTEPMDTFKSKIDSLNKRHAYWGFKGIKGQMFFNMAVNVANDSSECDAELKAALRIPDSNDLAKSRINNFVSYVKRIGDDHVAAGGKKHGRPKIRSIPFFLSYFWQIQDRHEWPIYYTSSVNVLADLNLWQPTNDIAEDYLAFKRRMTLLVSLFSDSGGKPFSLYDVEHVFVFEVGDPWQAKKVNGESKSGEVEQIPPISTKSDRLPQDYVPPIVAVLSQMAAHDPQLVDAAKVSGTTLDRAFEKHINATFTILGYESKLLGQGHGRVPDGVATDLDNSYAMIWDAKVRTNSYSIGTDDRTIREYITTQSRDLKKRRSLRNVYYLIVSSRFAEDYDDTIRSLKMDTDVSEVCLVEAEALIAMVDAKLRDPLGMSLGSDGIQRLFSTSGVLSADIVRTSLE